MLSVTFFVMVSAIVLSAVMVSVILLSVTFFVMLSLLMLSAIMLNDVLLSAMLPILPELKRHLKRVLLE